MCQYYCDSSTPSVVSPAQAYFYPSSLSQKQQTQHWRRFQTVGLVLEKTFLLKHLHLSYLPSASPEKVGSFPASCGRARGFTFLGALGISCCVQPGWCCRGKAGALPGQWGCSGGQGHLCVLSNIPQVVTVTQPELTEMDQRPQ